MIGHVHEGSVELLVPAFPNPEDDGYIDCSGVSPYFGSVDIAASPKWFNFAQRFVQPVAKILQPKPLNAMYFAGRGLGGRTTSLSLDAPVDPTIDVDETVQLSVGDPSAEWDTDDAAVATVDPNGLVTGVGPGTATITAYFGAEESWSMEITVRAAGGDLIAFTTSRNVTDLDANYEIYVMNTDGTAQVNITNSAGVDAGPVWSPDGLKIAFQSRRTAGIGDVWVMDADGSNPTNLTNNDAEFQLRPTWSPDGTQIAFMNRDPNDRVFVMDADGSNLALLDADAGWPSWSPDGTKIAFSTSRDGNEEIYVMDADGSNPVNLTSHAGFDIAPVWSPDGSKIGWHSTREGIGDVWIMDANGANPTNLTNTPAANDRLGTWSSDGLSIMFDSDRDGNPEIYVMNADGTGVTRITFDPADDFDPAWRP